ncbi:MAG TPA: TonB-dependent receptor, partial [Terriglobales bacterium]|nr:TonB-dependent receptor [Terriglobales bacterium]
QALTSLLANSGLTYRVVNDHTIAVTNLQAESPPAVKPTPPAPSNQKEGKNGSSGQFPVAQPNAGQNPAAASVEGPISALQTEEDSLQQVTVTGSHLKTTGSATVSPLQIITSDDIKNMGFNTVEDVLRSVSQNYGSLNSQTLRDQLSPYSQDALGQSAADLRGLGPENTLVLVNGHRRASSSTFGNIVNVNTIPVGSIDHIEIMTDGASAVYGSDAVAGVINFILKKNYQGGETHLRQELGENGGDSTTLEQTLGDNWRSGNVTFSGRFSKSNPVDSLRAGYTTSDFTARGGDDWDPTFYGQPGVVFSLGCLPPGDNGTNGVAAKLSPTNCVPYDLASNPYDVIAAQKTYSIDVNAEQSLSGWARAYAEFSFSKTSSDASNGAATEPFLTVPTTNRFNDLGTSPFVGYVFLNETRQGLLPGLETKTAQSAPAELIGVKFDLPKSWTLDVSFNHSREDTYFNSLRVDTDILNERVSGVDANGNPIPANQQLNVFGNGTAQNPAALNGLVHWDVGGYYIKDDYSTNDSGLVTAEGAVLHLPGGDARLAIGGELRREALYYNDVSYSTTLLVAEPSRRIEAGFGELNIPLVGENNRLPGIYSLNLYGAGRWEQYSINGPFDGTGAPERTVNFDQVSPKLGLSWHPVQELKVRATYGKSFVAPQLNQLFKSVVGPYNFIPYTDPTTGATVFPNSFITGNPNLKPETAKSYTAGLDWKPTGSLTGLAASVNYNRIDFVDRIADALDYYGTALFFNLPGVVVRDAAGTIVQVNLMPVNVATRFSESVDAQVTYDLNTHVGHLNFGIAGTYTDNLRDDAGGGAPPVWLAGTQNGPMRVKARAWTGWSRNKYGFNLYANYSSSYTNTNFSSPTALPPQSVEHYTTFDLNGFYELPKGFSIRAGVRNLTNAAFPFINNSQQVPWDSRIVDLRGRAIYLELSSKYGL